MYRLVDILTKLDELTGGVEPRSDGADLKALAACIAETLGAEACTIQLSDDDRDVAVPMPADPGTLEKPIVAGTKRHGSISLHGPRGKAGPKQAEALQIIAWCVARVLESTGMRCVLRSRYAQLAITKRPEVRRLLAASAQHPDKTARLLARTFYLELARSGFSCNQIINAASEIISQLSLNLQQQKNAASKAKPSVALSVAPTAPMGSAIESTAV